MKKKTLFLIIAGILLYCGIGYSQVGINTENPHKLTELEVTNLRDAVEDTVIPKGIMIPRLTERQRNVINVGDPSTANSLMIYNVDEDCYNYYSKTEKEWQSLCGKLGKAQFTLDCSTVRVGGKGTYFSAKHLDTSHYLEMTVDVTKAGAYTITAMPDPDNGYYFTLSGEFLTTGSYTLIVPGAGTPKNPSSDQDDLTTGDELNITLNGVDSGCKNVKIHIIDSTIKPVFTLNCGSGRPSGVYKIGQQLNNTHFITVVINGDVSGGAGAKAVLKTNEVDGMQFISNPIDIIGGPQTITLFGVGEPGSAGPKTFTISSNSTSSSATCEVQLNVVMKPKRILSIAHGTTYGYRWNYSGNARGAYAFFNDSRNFGSLNTSAVQIENLEVIGIEAGVLTYAALSPYLSGPQKADMIHIAYSTDFEAFSLNNIIKGLADYVKNGNPLFVMGDNNGAGPAGWTRLMQAIFEGSTASVTVENALPLAAGYAFRLSSANHPILNGPFGDIRDKCWGEDSSYAQVVLNLPVDEIIVFSDVVDVSTPGFAPTAAQADGVTAFVHRKFPLIYVGDGGFNSNDGLVSPTACPYKLDVSNFPIPKPNYGRGTNKQLVYNSAFVGNAVAWGLSIVEGVAKQ